MSKTNWKVKDKYNKKTYRSFRTQIPIDLAEKFAEKCKSEGVSMTEIIAKGMEKYIDENKGD